MNSYEEKQANRKERFLEKAENLRLKAETKIDESYKSLKELPLGQPILVGHYSEKKHRTLINKMNHKMDNAINDAKKAEYYERKAKAVGKGGISAHDPDAVLKIKQKIDIIKNEHERAKLANKKWRKIIKEEMTNNEDLEKAFKSAFQIFNKIDSTATRELLKQVVYYDINYWHNIKPYTTKSTEIKRLENRLKELQEIEENGSYTIEEENYKFTQDSEEMYLIFEFYGKPSKEVRNILKSNAFKWSQSKIAWVRKLTSKSILTVREIIEQLNDIFNQNNQS